jgi:peptidoglycan/xylan/chitin deacetylase (PgdA/CDA1 family)
VIQALKRTAYSLVRTAGGFSLVANSGWRRSRLLILCYHGVALSDECQWSPGLYLSADLLHRRLETLRRLRCNILPLGEAVERLYNRTLPERSVALTFDDGFFDFYQMAMPVLRQFDAPATVYVCTFYCSFPSPVFDPMLSYLLWKGSGKTLDWPEFLQSTTIVLTPENQKSACRRIAKAVAEAGSSAQEKDGVLRELAGRIGVDYDEICSRRILQLMNVEELRELPRRGFDLQLHTHRHRMPRDSKLFAREIEDNRHGLEAAATLEGGFHHFCYPSGVYYSDSGELLRKCGVLSATTCDPGLASRSSDPFYLPRYLDSTSVPDVVFEAWVTGASRLLPHRGDRRAT